MFAYVQVMSGYEGKNIIIRRLRRQPLLEALFRAGGADERPGRAGDAAEGGRLGGGGHQTMAAAQLKHITPEAARSRIQTAIDQYREAQKKSGLESESEQKKKDKQ